MQEPLLVLKSDQLDFQFLESIFSFEHYLQSKAVILQRQAKTQTHPYFASLSLVLLKERGQFVREYEESDQFVLSWYNFSSLFEREVYGL